MAVTHTWKRVFGFAAFGVVAGGALFAFTDLETDLAVLFACAIVAAVIFHYWRRSNSRRKRSATETKDGGTATREEFLLERWRRDLDHDAAGVRSPSVPSKDWGPLGRDELPTSSDGMNRE